MPEALSTYSIKTQWICIGIYFFLSSYTGFSQSKVKLKRKITTDSVLDFQVNIINPSQHTGTISKKDGSFEVFVSKGDELIFYGDGL
ncbi:MAG TPA: hypothetical protein VK021_08955 [Flavobacteriaceae bacterium]|nr:hypothetical protein [Flavobacteriaceae bacterium]